MNLVGKRRDLRSDAEAALEDEAVSNSDVGERRRQDN
jgi:hypothetical protein